MSQVITPEEFLNLVARAQRVYVGVTTPSGRILYFEIEKELAALEVEKLIQESIPLEMDNDGFLWLGDPDSPLRVAGGQ